MFRSIKLAILSIALLASTNSFAKQFGQIDEGKFILLPLPFYGSDTGAGMTLKMLHTNVGAGTFIDFTGFATTESMMGAFATIGQKHVPSNKLLFWSVKAQKVDVEQKIYGIGNEVPLDGYATFNLNSLSVTPKFGLYLSEYVKLYATFSHATDMFGSFEDGEHGQREIWETLDRDELTTNKVGGGIEISYLDDDVRPMAGYALKYEYGTVTPSFLGNDVSYRHSFASLAAYVPMSESWSHGIHARYNSISCSAPFYKYPEIEVRGVDSKRHNNCKSMVLQNETRVYFADNWAWVPFVDVGKVSDDEDTSLRSDLHWGGGMGVRYVIKDALVVRADLGVTRGGESAFLFNYGHTF